MNKKHSRFTFVLVEDGVLGTPTCPWVCGLELRKIVVRAIPGHSSTRHTERPLWLILATCCCFHMTVLPFSLSFWFIESPSVFLSFPFFLPVSNIYYCLHSSLITKTLGNWYTTSLWISTQTPGYSSLNFSFPMISSFPPRPPTSIPQLWSLQAEAAPFPKSPIKAANSPKVTLLLSSVLCASTSTAICHQSMSFNLSLSILSIS